MDLNDDEKSLKFREHQQATSRYFESNASHVFVNNVNPFNSVGDNAGDIAENLKNKWKNDELINIFLITPNKELNNTPSKALVNEIIKNDPFNKNIFMNEQYDEIHEAFIAGNQGLDRKYSQPIVTMSANLLDTQYITSSSRDVPQTSLYDYQVSFDEYNEGNNRHRAFSSNEMLTDAPVKSKGRAEKTTYCRPLLNMFNEEFVYKTMQRNARLQKLVRKLVVAREREKQREAWNNYINDLKNKHKYYSNEPSKISPQYVPDEDNTYELIDDCYNTRFNWRQSNPCQHLQDFYGAYGSMPPSMCNKYQRDYDSSLPPDIGSFIYNQNRICYPTSSQSNLLRWNKERQGNDFAYGWRNRPPNKYYRGNALLIEKEQKGCCLFNKMQGSYRPSHLSCNRPIQTCNCKNKVCSINRNTPKSQADKTLPLVNEEEDRDIYYPYKSDGIIKDKDIQYTTTNQQSSTDEMDVRVPYNQDTFKDDKQESINYDRDVNVPHKQATFKLNKDVNVPLKQKRNSYQKPGTRNQKPFKHYKDFSVPHNQKTFKHDKDVNVPHNQKSFKNDKDVSAWTQEPFKHDKAVSVAFNKELFKHDKDVSVHNTQEPIQNENISYTSLLKLGKDLNNSQKQEAKNDTFKGVTNNINKLKRKIRQSEEDTSLKSLANIEEKIDGLMTSINSIMLDMKTRKNVYVNRKSAAVSCCTFVASTSRNNLNRQMSDPYGLIKNEEYLFDLVRNSSKSVTVSEFGPSDLVEQRQCSNSKIDRILLEEMKKSDQVKRDIEDLLNMRNENNYSVQISFDIPTKERSTEVTDSLSKAKLEAATDVVVEEIRSDGPSEISRRMEIAVNTDPLGLLALLRVSTDTVKQLFSYVPNLNYNNYLSLLHHLQIPARTFVSHYICNICGASFCRPSLLSTHIRTHNLGKTRDCCVCRHTLDLPRNRAGLFSCRYCGKKFTRAYCCELHQQTCAKQLGKRHDVNSGHMLLR